MKIDRLKVRPKRDKTAAPCAAEFAALLACWASSNDLGNTGACATNAEALHQCLGARGARRTPHKSTINYHLARFSKKV